MDILIFSYFIRKKELGRHYITCNDIQSFKADTIMK